MRGLPGQGWADENRLCRRVDRGELTLLLLDTLVPGGGGEFGDAHRDWLDAHCPDGRRVVVAMHHPPCALGIAGMAASPAAARIAGRLAGREGAGRGGVVRHVHRPVATVFAREICC
jgi:3',5'-cyclic AMP phosphodiesterase CpdA